MILSGIKRFVQRLRRLGHASKRSQQALSPAPPCAILTQNHQKLGAQKSDKQPSDTHAVIPCDDYMAFLLRGRAEGIYRRSRLGIPGHIAAEFMSKNFEGIIKSGDIYLPYMFNIVLDLIKSILTSITLAVAVVAALDYGYEKFSHKKGLKMTKQEVKEEYKQMEGDPHIKGKIKQKQRQMANQRMMQAVPSSTVIVTNPTHISIAIRYEQGKDTTPIVVAKGVDEVAFRIREIAKSHDIPIIENVPLARLIYKEVDIDQEIPEEMYKAVAEVLVAVYKIKNKYK